MRRLRAILHWNIGPAVLAVVWALGSPFSAGAATLTVCASGCDHTTIQAAHNAAAAGDIIEVQDAVHTELNITITKSVTVQGLGAMATIVQAAATPGTAGNRVFFIPGSAGGPISVTLRRMTIRHGRAGAGGGIHANGINGAVDLRIENATLSQNQAASQGGAINANTGSRAVNLTIVDSTLDGNTALLYSAVTTFGPGVFTMTGSTVSNNTNTAMSGSAGVIDPSTNFAIANSTVSGNSGGPGIITFSVGSIVNSTISGNGLAGIRRLSGTLRVSNSIVSDNNPDCQGTLTIPAGAPNLASDGSCTGFTLQNANADLDPLADNGGPTWTHALGLASDALDAGDDAICAAAPVNGVDQRGVARPQGAHCDLGAFELVQNQSPDCSGASPSVAQLWPPNHGMIQVSIQGVTDPDGDPVSIEIDQIRQDEPTDGLGDGNTCPDGEGIGTATASVRAERSALANGRVYTISFTASDGAGGTCQGSVKVCVPRNRHDSCVDGGPTVDSTECGGGAASLVREPSAFHSHEKPDGLLGLLCFSHAPTLDCDLLCDVGALLCL